MGTDGAESRVTCYGAKEGAGEKGDLGCGNTIPFARVRFRALSRQKNVLKTCNKTVEPIPIKLSLTNRLPGLNNVLIRHINFRHNNTN